MKSKEEIEQLANEYAKQFDYAEDSSPFLDYIEGYTQCQEDMATILFNILKLVNEPYTEHSRLTDIKDYINSLNKKDLPIINGSYGCTIETLKNKQD